MNYESELERGVNKLFGNTDLVIGVIGGRERWYKSIDGKEEYDGDSLYAKIKDTNYKLIDGVDIDDVGVFWIYQDTFRKVKINSENGVNDGFMIAYAKIRELSGPSHNATDKEIRLNLLVVDAKTKEFKKQEFDYYLLNNFLTMPLLPEVYVNDTTSELKVTAKVVEPHSLSFSTGPKEDFRNYSRSLSKFGISLEQAIFESLDPKRVRDYISSIAPSLGCDYTYEPIFPENNKSVCAIRHMAENGISYGFNTLYLVWNGKDGKMHHREIYNTRLTKDYINIRKIVDDGTSIIIDYGSGGSYSGHPWDKQFRIEKKELDI
ncbi:MAG: hypothetical protein QXK76_03420 [Candidatus Woesearchaeota archaeon]